MGFRSGQYAKSLRQEGFDVRNLSGSIVSWTHENYPLVTGPDPGTATKKVHVFADQWKLQGNGYEPVVFQKGRTLLEAARSIIPTWLGGIR